MRNENEYGKGKDYQGKTYQAASNKENRNPNAPTQGGFSTPGGSHGQPLKDKTKNPQANRPTQTNQNTWGKGSIGQKSDQDKNRS